MRLCHFSFSRRFLFTVYCLALFVFAKPAIGMMSVRALDDIDKVGVDKIHKKFRHSTGPINVLSIDGGGVRGIIPAAFLERLEDDLNQGRDPSLPRVKICDIFDLIVGTSVGSLIALGASTPYGPDPENQEIRTASEIRSLCQQLSSDIFPPPIMGGMVGDMVDLLSRSKYPAKPLEDNLLNYFGDSKLSNVRVPVVVTSVDAHFNTLKLYRNYRAKIQPNEDHYVRDVAYASSAAPTYLPMKIMPSLGVGEDVVSLVDGGMGANNPALIALSEVFLKT